MMKKTNKRSILAIVFAAMFVFASVAGIFLPKQASAVGKRGKIRSVRVTSVKKLTAGKTSKIKVKVNPKKVAAKVTFKTSNKSIATVSRKGVVKAKRPGRVTIAVKAKSKNTKTKRVKIRVIPKKTSTKKKTPKKKKKQTTSKNTTKRNDKYPYGKPQTDEVARGSGNREYGCRRLREKLPNFSGVSFFRAGNSSNRVNAFHICVYVHRCAVPRYIALQHP